MSPMVLGIFRKRTLIYPKMAERNTRMVVIVNRSSCMAQMYWTLMRSQIPIVPFFNSGSEV